MLDQEIFGTLVVFIIRVVFDLVFVVIVVISVVVVAVFVYVVVVVAVFSKRSKEIQRLGILCQ